MLKPNALNEKLSSFLDKIKVDYTFSLHPEAQKVFRYKFCREC